MYAYGATGGVEACALRGTKTGASATLVVSDGAAERGWNEIVASDACECDSAFESDVPSRLGASFDMAVGRVSEAEHVRVVCPTSTLQQIRRYLIPHGVRGDAGGCMRRAGRVRLREGIAHTVVLHGRRHDAHGGGRALGAAHEVMDVGRQQDACARGYIEHLQARIAQVRIEVVRGEGRMPNRPLRRPLRGAFLRGPAAQRARAALVPVPARERLDGANERRALRTDAGARIGGHGRPQLRGILEDELAGRADHRAGRAGHAMLQRRDQRLRQVPHTRLVADRLVRHIRGGRCLGRCGQAVHTSVVCALVREKGTQRMQVKHIPHPQRCGAFDGQLVAGALGERIEHVGGRLRRVLRK